VDDLNHAFNFLGSDGPCSGLLPQQVHHVGGELVAGLVVLLQLLVVDGPDPNQTYQGPHYNLGGSSGTRHVCKKSFDNARLLKHKTAGKVPSLYGSGMLVLLVKTKFPEDSFIFLLSKQDQDP
jgi:hypothetical protein